MCQKAHRQRNRQTDKSPLVSSSSPLSSLRFCSFFPPLCCFVVQSQRWDARATLCCLSAFNICMPLPHSPRTSISSSADFFLPSSSQIFVPLCPIFFNLSCILFTLLFFYLTLSLCATLAATSFFSFIFFFSCLFSLVVVSQAAAWFERFSAFSSSQPVMLTCAEMNTAE